MTKPTVGKPFSTLCDKEVTPNDDDMIVGTWFDPECETCLLELCKLTGWPQWQIDKLMNLRRSSKKEAETGAGDE